MNDKINNNRLIKVSNLCKNFPGVRALSNVNFELKVGELHCIVGENGAGKSTFIKILSGALIPDGGEIYIFGNKYKYLDPAIAKKNKIFTIYQEAILVPQMSVAENIFINVENTNKLGLIDYKTTNKKAYELINKIGLNLKPSELVENLEPAEKQFVKILKSLVTKPNILIMDEPTTMLDKGKLEILFNLIEQLKEEGVGIIYISHHLEDILRVADKITVLKDGYVVKSHDKNKEKITIDMLASEMVGRSFKTFYQRRKKNIGKVVLAVEDLAVKGFNKKISFKLHKGEILGIAGMVGSGRTELVRALFGADRKLGGKVYYKGKEITIKNPNKAISVGIGLLTEDRQKNGLTLNRSVQENISIVGLDNLGSIFINQKKELKAVIDYVRRLNIKTPSLNQEVMFLSGGNQQKVVLAKWLFKDVDILIFDEPTKGIDINTKKEIYKLMDDLVSRDKAIIMVSSEMPELISISDRVIVVRKGAISEILSGQQITEENILINSIGGK